MTELEAFLAWTKQSIDGDYREHTYGPDMLEAAFCAGSAYRAYEHAQYPRAAKDKEDGDAERA